MNYVDMNLEYPCRKSSTPVFLFFSFPIRLSYVYYSFFPLFKYNNNTVCFMWNTIFNASRLCNCFFSKPLVYRNLMIINYHFPAILQKILSTEYCLTKRNYIPEVEFTILLNKLGIKYHSRSWLPVSDSLLP